MGSASDENLESVKASNIISEQFSSSVANNSLVIVISTNNASSIQTQQFIEQLTKEIKSNSSISGVENVSDVYSLLIPALNQTNDAAYIIYDNANMTYNMLYGVPTMYFNVWEAAYNETQASLISGLNETNHGVYLTFDNANMTYNMLYAVPATYLNAWSEAYSLTLNVSLSNEIAYNQTSVILYLADPASFNLYMSPLLDAFNATWSLSFLDPTTATWTPIQRASFAADQTNQLYINNFLAGNETEKNFATALTSTFKLEDFLTNSEAQNTAKLRDFSVEYVANSTSDVSLEFVEAAYDLGRNPSSSALKTLAINIIWHPETYNMGQEFIPLLNEIAYDESAKLLRETDLSSFNHYTCHLLDTFNAYWSISCQNLATYLYTPTYRAIVVTDQAIPQYINSFLGNNDTAKDFATALSKTFTLNDFLNNNQTRSNVELLDFALSYLSNSSGLSLELVNATYNMGKNPDLNALRRLAGSIVWNPQAYNIGQGFNTLITSFVSPSKDVTIVSVNLVKSSYENLIAIRDIIDAKLAESQGINFALVTGSDALNYDFSRSTAQDLELILPVTIVLLLVATGLFFKSIVTPIVTLGTIGVGLGISQIFPYLVGTYINEVDFMVPTILLTVLIGVGTDYSIFIIARHREERVNGLPLREAIIKSVTWAGESIVTSGATVIISFLALAATSIILLQTLGLVVGLGVIVVLIVSLTFAPALTAVLGDRIFWPNTGERFQRYAESTRKKSQKKNGYFARSGSFSVKHAKVVVLVAIIITVPTFYVYATTTPTYDFLGGASKNLESISASQTLTDSFGGGKLFPSYVVVTFAQPLVNAGVFNMTEMSALKAICSQLVGHEDVQEVTGPTMPYSSPIAYENINATSDAATFNSIMQNIGSDNKSALITLRFKVDPYSTQAMNDAQDIRTSLHQNYDNTGGITGIYFGGTTGETLDTKNLFADQFNIILPIVAVGVGIVLFIVLGSLFLPLFAVVSVLMSIVWTLAATAIVFQSAFNYGLLFITPLILFVLLLGLGMDYNIFILTRIREEAVKGKKLNEAIVHAIEQTGGIITAAAIILAGSLGALMLSSNLLLKEMGFAFLFSILIDALVVRTYFVPAVMSALGKWNWYSAIKRLSRMKENDATSTVNVQ
jgi:RND superfamily putative drug exporter